MKLSELFHSIQGEGRLAGIPSVFIRTSFCNLRCWWCDTPYTSWTPEFFDISVQELVQRTKELATDEGHNTKHVVITGGEPFMQRRELPELCERISAEGFHVTIETNATIFLPVQANLISMSPKLSNSTPKGAFEKSHEKYRLKFGVMREFLQVYVNPPGQDVQVKFVVDSESDLEEIRQLEQQVPIAKDKILLMPQARERDELAEKSKWLKQLCAKEGYSFSPRLHIELFGNRRAV